MVERAGASRPFVARTRDVQSYSPVNHVGAVDRGLIGPETVGAANLEVVRGSVEPGEGAVPPLPPGMEKVCCAFRGTERVEVGDRAERLGPGDCPYFAADAERTFTSIGDEPAEIVVIYGPPTTRTPSNATGLSQT